jgi:N utilization substance protein A
MEVVVPDDQLSLAIGRRGQNVRLASKISGWHLDVISETSYSQNLREAYDSLLDLEEVGDATATSLYQAGFRSASDVAGATVEELSTVQGIGEEKGARLIKSASEYVERKRQESLDSEMSGPEAEGHDVDAAEAEAAGTDEEESPEKYEGKEPLAVEDALGSEAEDQGESQAADEDNESGQGDEESS